MAYDPEALDGLKMEKEVFGVSDGTLAEQIFAQHAAQAAMKICHLATNAGSEQLQLRASQYVCDRVLGSVKAGSLKPDEKQDALRDFVEGIVSRNS